MKEYLIKLDIEPFYVIALALSLEEAREIVDRRYGNDHVLQVLQFIYTENKEALSEPL
jgi:hypothetical protein